MRNSGIDQRGHRLLRFFSVAASVLPSLAVALVTSSIYQDPHPQRVACACFCVEGQPRTLCQSAETARLGIMACEPHTPCESLANAPDVGLLKRHDLEPLSPQQLPPQSSPTQPPPGCRVRSGSIPGESETLRLRVCNLTPL